MKILNEKAIIVGLEKINLNDFPNLKVIGCNMTSCEHLPFEEMEKRGIKLISLKGHTEFLKYITSTSEHTLGLILAVMRNYKTALNAPYKNREEYKGHTLSDKTICLIGGNGRIGRQMQKICGGLGMKVRVHEKHEPLKNLWKDLKESDIVSIHIPLQGNEGFFRKDMFALMKPTAILINTSRDKVIEKGALTFALKNNIISGAGIDFIDDPELLEYSENHNNLILTNHLGGATFEDQASTEGFIIKLIKNYLEKNAISN